MGVFYHFLCSFKGRFLFCHFRYNLVVQFLNCFKGGFNVGRFSFQIGRCGQTYRWSYRETVDRRCAVLFDRVKDVTVVEREGGINSTFDDTRTSLNR